MGFKSLTGKLFPAGMGQSPQAVLPTLPKWQIGRCQVVSILEGWPSSASEALGAKHTLSPKDVPPEIALLLLGLGSCVSGCSCSGPILASRAVMG